MSRRWNGLGHLLLIGSTSHVHSSSLGLLVICSLTLSSLSPSNFPLLPCSVGQATPLLAAIYITHGRNRNPKLKLAQIVVLECELRLCMHTQFPHATVWSNAKCLPAGGLVRSLRRCSVGAGIGRSSRCQVSRLQKGFHRPWQDIELG